MLPVGLDFASGLDMKTPWARLPAVSGDLRTTQNSEYCIMYNVHNNVPVNIFMVEDSARC